MKNQYSRRKFFSKLISGKGKSKDALFEKYKRKDYSYRHYEQVNEDARIGAITSGLSPYTGSWTAQQALHLLRRTQYGFKKTDVDTIVSIGMNSAVNLLLNIGPDLPSPPINYYQNILADEGNIAYGADWTQNAFSTIGIGNSTNNIRNDSLTFWNVGLALNQELNIREKMTWFWYHFIPINFDTIRVANYSYCGSNSARISYDFINHSRSNSVGNFKNFIRNIATQPAMMFYLNNQSNTNTAPDENFAREVMELFTLGKDPLSQYTEDDVKNAAKILTGWRVQNLNSFPTFTSFDSSLHDTTVKTFSSFFNNATIENTGATELDTFIDLIFSKTQVVSEYICRRLYRYFVYYDIDANIEANVITPLAQHFVANNWEILPVLDKLFKSQHFYDMVNFGVYIKSPFDLVIGSLRTFNLNYNVSDPTNHEAQYYVWRAVNNKYLATIDQEMGNVPTVSGWNPFYQNPNFHEYWINSSTIQKRGSFIDLIFNGVNLNYNGLLTRIEVDTIAWVQQFPDATISDPDLLVNTCVGYLLPVDLSPSVKSDLKIQNLLSNQISNSYWTTAWNNYIANPTNTSNTTIVKQRIKSLLLAITQLAEYQLM